MPYTKKSLGRSQIEFCITVTPDACRKHLEKAAERISMRVAVKGFRKGHAPYDLVKREVGDMAILEEALKSIIKESFYAAVTDEGLDTVGMPKVEIEKMAPGNDVVYKATVALLPVVHPADPASLSIAREVKPVEEKHIADTIDAIRGMHATEILKHGAAEGTDKLVIDMDMFIDAVPVEGGQAKNYQVYLSEPHYIPGFNEQVAGLKSGDEKTFSLDFPPTHYQKHLAGKKVDIKVKVQEVYERHLPELSDDLAKKLGQESAEILKQLIADNLRQEAEQKADRQFEMNMLDAMIAGSTFEEIPDVIIDAERQKMMYELKRDLDKHGISLESYLADLKKKEQDIFNEFKAEAEKRAKAALLSRQISKDNGLSATDDEVKQEIAGMKEMYKNDKDYLERLDLPEVKDTVATMIQNKKVLAWMKERVSKK